MKKIAVIFAIILAATSLQAQSDAKAKAVLDKAAAILKKNTATKIDFTLTIEDTQSNQKESMKGDIVMQGVKFRTNTPLLQTYFDGKNQYVYMAKNKEVSISIPTKEELQENPALLLSNYSQESSVHFSLDDKSSLPYYTLDLFPDLKSKKTYFKSIIKIDRKTSALISIKVLSKNGIHTLFEVNKIEAKDKYNDNFFVFDTKANPKVIINDLR